MHKSLYGLAVLLLFFSSQLHAEPFSITISRASGQSQPQKLATDYFVKLLEERSLGEIKASLVEAPESQPGALKKLSQLALVPLADAASASPQLEFLQLPFVFRDRQHLYQFLATEAGQLTFRTDRQEEFIPLTLWEFGFYQRVTKSKAARPEQGQEGSWQTFSDMQYNDVSGQERLLSELVLEQPAQGGQIVLSNRRLSAKVLIATRSFWNATPDDLKVIIMGAIKDATLYFRELAQQEELQALTALKNGALKIYHPTPAQRTDWQTAAHNHYPRAMSDTELQLLETISILNPAN